MRENKTLAGIIGMMVAGGLGLVVVLLLSYFGYAASIEQYQAASNNIAVLKGAKLFPSEEHVKARETAITEYEDEVSRLGTVLLALQQPAKPLTDTEFQAMLKTLIAETRQAAAGKTDLPREFAFGFDIYNTSLPRSGEAATQLGDYLAAVNAIVNTIIASGVKSIDSIERSELAVEKGTPPPPPEPPKEAKKAGVAKKGGKGGTEGRKAAPVKEIAKVVERRTVTLTLTADQGPLQLIMNKLASPSEMVHFTVVRQLRVENEKQEGPLRGSLANLGAPSEPQTPTEPPAVATAAAPPVEGTAPATPTTPASPAPAAPTKTQVVEAAKPAPRDAQPVFGAELLKVYMEIDLVRFLEPASAEGGAAR